MTQQLTQTPLPMTAADYLDNAVIAEAEAVKASALEQADLAASLAAVAAYLRRKAAYR